MGHSASSRGSGLDLRKLSKTLFGDALAPQAPVIDGFTALTFIARGGLGEVWRAFWEEKERMPVAIKVPRRVDDEFFARLEAEASALQALDHPNIVRLLDVRLAEDGRPCLILEFIEGRNLADTLPPAGFFVDEALRAFRQVLDAVEAAHGRGIIHRDLKPSNILVDAYGAVKVTDFGLAADIDGRAVRLALTESGTVAGTVEYLPPEAFHRDTRADERTDIYALGILLYELLTGEPPRGGWQDASAIRHVDVRLDDLIHKAIHRERDKRYRSVGELRADLEKIAASRPRYAGTPRCTRACRVADALWSIAGCFALLLAVSTAFHLDKSVTRLPLNLFGGHSGMICAWLTVKTLLITGGAMALWQTVRLWRFRHVPMREALPSPFGLALGEGALAATLVLLTQVFLFILPLILAGFFFGSIDWRRPDATTWGHVLAVTDYLGHPIGIWDWSANWDGKDAWLREVTMNTDNWYVDPQTPHDKVSFYPGFQPAVMVAGLFAVVLALGATTLCTATSWWERRRMQFIVVSALVMGALGVWQWLKAVDRRREVAHELASNPDPDSTARRESFEEFTRDFLRKRNIGGNYDERLQDYAPQVEVNGNAMARDTGLRQYLLAENGVKNVNGRTWESTAISHTGTLDGGEASLKRHYFDSPESYGHTAVGGLEELYLVWERSLEGRIEITREKVVTTPYFQAKHLPPGKGEMETFIDDFLEALAEPECLRLEAFLAPRMLLTAPEQARLLDEL